jgi:integrase
VIRAILRKAADERDRLIKAPVMRRPSAHAARALDQQEEAERLLEALPPHLRAMAKFSLETGLGKSNVNELNWSQVDLTRRCAWIQPDQAKARKAVAVSLSVAAVIVKQNETAAKVVTI